MEKENKEAAKQRVIITPELGVIIKTQNGTIENGKESVLIEGEFTISSSNVALLTAALAGKSVCYGSYGITRIISGDEAVKALVEETNMLRKKCDNTENQLTEKLITKEDERYKLKCEVAELRNRIKIFNAERRLWERKLIIDEK
ncbi:MAG: hypothetical protein J6V00_05280 [Bacteroidaceae bacterium]|nr:hypothetical protein [Bacteroidaceae bacterium]